MIEISVIIPVFNKENFLRKCLESVLNSSFKNYEIICIDDASADRSWDILCEFKQYNNITLMKNECNVGVAETRNKGICQAKGKYVFFLDADDFILPQALEIYVAQMEKADAQGCFIPLSINDSKQTTLKGSYPQIYCGLNMLDEFVKNNESFLYACGAIWEREFLLQHNIQFRKLKVGEGGLFILESLVKAERIVCSDFAGYRYMVNETSTSSQKGIMDAAAFGQLYQIIFMIKNIEDGKDNEKIVRFLDWYLKNNIGGIKNLRTDGCAGAEMAIKDCSDRFLAALIRGDYLNKDIKLEDDAEAKIRTKGKMYIYGAGYETMDAIRFAHKFGVEIEKIFVTSKTNNPDNIYGFHVYEFKECLIPDKSIPFLITAHRKHQNEIKELLIKNGIKNIFSL